MESTAVGGRFGPLWKWFVGAGLALASAAGASALTLHSEKSGPTDLEISGLLAGVPAGESRWLRWADLRALPTRELEVEGEFLPGRQRVTLVFLQDVLDRLPLAPGADTVTAVCHDGYAGVFTREFTEKWRPYVVLEINGVGPEQWPPAGMTFNPGPYVLTASEHVAPGVGAVLDLPHKQPWGVTAIKLVRYADEFAPFMKGEWAALSERAERGRELWVNSCYSCHKGPGEVVGGTKGGRPFAVLRAYAEHNKKYFRDYVRNPQGLNPSAKMTAHPHYTDEQLAELMAFIVGEKPKS